MKRIITILLSAAVIATAQQKVSERTSLTSPTLDTAADLFPVVDMSETGSARDKKTTLAEMWKNLGGTSVSPTELGYLDGVTSSIQTQLAAREPALGNPGTNGYVLSSTTGGTRSWIQATSNLTSGPVTSSGGVSAIADAALSIAKTSGLQTALDAKPALVISGTGNAFVFEGDSITTTAGIPGAGNDWPSLLMAMPALSGKGTKYNVATASETLANITSQYASQVYPHRPTANGGDGGATPVLFVMIGANDMTSVPATYIAALETYWQTAKTDGFIVVAYTITPGNYFTAGESVRQAVNAGIRRSSVWDYLVDASAVLPDQLDTSVYSDGLHPTLAGNRVLARETQTVLLTRRGSPHGDTTATKAIGGPVNVGKIMTEGGSSTMHQFGVSSSRPEPLGIGIFSRTEWAPTANSASATTGSVSQVFKKGAQAVDGAIRGVEATVTNRGAGAIYEVAGFTTHVGNQTDVFEAGTGAVTNLYHYRAESPITSGTNAPITTAYGLHIGQQKVTGVTNAYSIYQAGANDVNYFAGDMTFGKALRPGNGTVGTPLLGVGADTDSGFYSPNGTQHAISINGTQRFNATESGVTTAGAVTNTVGAGGAFTITGTSYPIVKLINTASGSDAKNWDYYWEGNSLVHRAMNEANNAGTSWLTVNRSGYTIPSIVFDSTLLSNTGDIATTTVGKTVKIKSGSNALAGTVTLTAGAGTISSTALDANTVIVLTLKTVSGTVGGQPYVDTITAGASATLVGGGGSNNSVYNWVAMKVN